MEDKNILIVRECIEQIFNLKHFDRLFDYFSENCISHSPPYVGMGLSFNDSSGDRFLITLVANHAPASGKLFPGDVILRATDGTGTWEGFEQLRYGTWGFGVLGTPVTLTVQRGGLTQEITLQRGLVQEFDSTMKEFSKNWLSWVARETPDLHTEIDLIFATGDQVAYYATNTATNPEHKRSAVWSECDIMRLAEGKIVDWWGVEDSLSMWRQFGHRLVPPGKA